MEEERGEETKMFPILKLLEVQTMWKNVLHMCCFHTWWHMCE